MIRGNNYSNVDLATTIKYAKDNFDLFGKLEFNESAYIQACRMIITCFDKEHKTNLFDGSLIVIDGTPSHYGWPKMNEEVLNTFNDFLNKNEIPFILFRTHNNSVSLSRTVIFEGINFN